MRPLRPTAFAVSLLAGVALATPAGAANLPFAGELAIRIGVLDPIRAAATGSVLAGTAGDHITSAVLAPDTFVANRELVPVTDPAAFPIAGVLGTFSNDWASFTEDAGGAMGGPMPLRGVVKVCLFGPCYASSNISNIDVPLSVVGQGGSETVVGAVSLTVAGAPWTTGTAAIGTEVTRGGRRGPNGLASSTALVGGELNAVTPIFVSTNISASAVVPVFGILRLGIGSLGLPACDDNVDNDGDGLVDHPTDPGCTSASDSTETDPTLACDDGADNDGDGTVDFPQDLGCLARTDTTEGPALRCDVEMSDSFYAVGETVVISTLRFQNLDPTAATTRVRLELKFPPPFAISVQAVDIGADGSFAVPAGFDKQLGPATMFTLNPSIPIRGSFEWRCAFEDPATGAVIAEDRAPFYLSQ
jgi:hypothetical protein